MAGQSSSAVGIDQFCYIELVYIGECMALWGEPNKHSYSIQHYVLQYVDS